MQMARDAEKLAAQAERLRDLKDQARGTTFAKIAEATDTTERQVQRWFAGDSDIGPENLKRLAKFLGTTPDYIEYGREREPRKTPSLAQVLPGNPQLDRIEAKLDLLLAAVNQPAEDASPILQRALDRVREAHRQDPANPQPDEIQAVEGKG